MAGQPYESLDDNRQLVRRRRLLAASDALGRLDRGYTQRRAVDRLASGSTGREHPSQD